MINRSKSRHILYAFCVSLMLTASYPAVASDTWYYDLDAVGNITSRGLDPAPENATHSYTYDELYRLINEINPNNTDQYDYDPNGNRTEFIRDGSGTTYQIDTNSNRLDQVGSDQITYDDAGNITSDRNGSRTFSYNEAGRLSEVHENGQLLATYTYNAQGQRVIKTTPSSTTYYDYDLNGQLIGEYDQSGQPIKEYAHLGGSPIAQIEGSSITYLHTDHLATPRKATNEAGQVVWQWDSEAFGNKLPESSGGTEVNLRFPGQYYDAETGLYYNYFRTYDPSTGRYITSDPIGLQGGLNTYGYVNSNPIRLVDPWGLDVEVGVRPFSPIPVPYARHCFVRFNGSNNDTLSFDNEGVHPDPDPGSGNFSPTTGQQDDPCVRREMNQCDADDYDFTQYNCCHCVSNALHACELSNQGPWPNSPYDASAPPFAPPVPTAPPIFPPIGPQP